MVVRLSRSEAHKELQWMDERATAKMKSALVKKPLHEVPPQPIDGRRRFYATLECSMVQTLSPLPTALPVSISMRRGFIASGSSRSSSI